MNLALMGVNIVHIEKMSGEFRVVSKKRSNPAVEWGLATKPLIRSLPSHWKGYTMKQFNLEDTAVILIDHQVGTNTWASTTPLALLQRNVLMRAA